jgi:tetratricopeptide (TPR) repeat protein
MMHIHSGTTIRQYQIDSVIGRGGMGIVYRATDTRLQQNIALKVLYPNLASQESYFRRFFREGQAVTRLNHPNIVRIYEVGQEDSACFIAMEYVEGQTLSSFLEHRGALPVEEALDIGIQIASGLECSHGQGVLHRDIKSGNIMITPDGLIKILDFGLARIAGVSALTMTGNVVGTVDYISPEQVMNDKVDGRSDLYSFGIVLYEMLTGQLPFAGDEPISIIYQHINDDPIPPSSIRPQLPVEVDRIVMTMIAKRPINRFPSASVTREELASCRAALSDLYEKQKSGLSSGVLHEQFRLRGRDEFACPVIGRDEELQALKTCIDITVTGKGGLEMIGGIEGTGKSRLMREALDYAASKGMWTFSGGCLYQEMAMPYQPVIDALSHRLAALSPAGNNHLRALIKEHYPAIAGLMPHVWSVEERKYLEETAPATLSPAAEQQRLFQSILQLLFQLADERGILIGLDDMHWADTGTAQLLHYLARQVDGRSISIIVAFRPEEVSETSEAPFAETMRRLQSEQIGHTMLLDNLNDRAIHSIVREIMSSRAIPASIGDRVYKESGGNPLFAIEILKWWRDRSRTHVLDQGALEQIEENTELIPPRITDLIARRLNRLNDHERELLEVAAIGGVRFYVDGLAVTMNMGRMETLRNLHRMERRHGLVQPVERGLYQFSHGKIQEVLYRDLPEALRQEYHAAWSRTFLARKESGEEVPVEILATHLYLGGNEAEAFPYLMQAGERARKMRAFREARKYWEQAEKILNNQDEDTSQDSRIEVMLNLGRIYYDLGDWNQATEYNKQTFGIAQKAKKINPQAKALQQLGAILVGRNQWNAAIQLFEQSMKLYEQAQDDMGIGSVNNYLGNIAYWRGQWEKATFFYDQALYIFKNKNELLNSAIVNSNLGNIYYSQGDNEKAIDYYNNSFNINKVVNNILGIAEVDINLGMVYERMEQWDKALEYHRDSVDLLERMGHTRQLWNAYINYSRVLARIKDVTLAGEIITKAHKILKDIKSQRGMAEARRVDGLIASMAQEWKLAGNMFDESERLCLESKDPYGHAETLRERGYMFIEKGDHKQGIHFLHQAEQAFQAIGAKGDVTLIQSKLKNLEMTWSHSNEQHHL